MNSALKHISFMLCALIISIQPVAAEENSRCAADDKACLFTLLESLTGEITESRWRDLTYREIAKLLATEKRSDESMTFLARIDNPDTKALTIRGIGMAASGTDMTSEEFTVLFTSLRAEAEKIEHKASYAIALTYIAMAQAFAGDNDGAMKTAKDMENDALRNKALAESAEIQAEKGHLPAAKESIAAIDSAAYRDKAYRLVSEIFSKTGRYDDAIDAAMAIENAYQKAQSVLFVLARQITPEEVSLVE